MKLYIAGPMRGLPEFNFPAFYAAEYQLRSLGFEVFNPARYDVQTLGFRYRGTTGKEDLAELGFPLHAAIERDLEAIREWADGIALLPGWQDSEGAAREIETARELGKPARELDDHLRMGTLARERWEAIGELGLDCAAMVARSVSSSYPHVEEDDVFQDAVEYLVTHRAEMERQVAAGAEHYGEERAELGARRFVIRQLRQRMAAKAERESAKRSAVLLAVSEAPEGDDVDLTRWGNRPTPPEYAGLGYNPAVIEAALPMLWDGSRAGQMEATTGVEEGMPKASSNLASTGTPWAIYADVRTAWADAGLTDEARRSLYLVYGVGLSQVDVAAMEGVSQQAIAGRVDRGLMRMADHLNGTERNDENMEVAA